MRLLFLLLPVLFLGCDLVEETNFETSFELNLWVDAQLDFCKEKEGKCFRVQSGEDVSPGDTWSILELDINGFNYQPGVFYQIRVLVESFPEPLENGSYFRYSLINVLTRQNVEASGVVEIKKIWIGPKMVDCVGVGPRTCLMVQHGEEIDPAKWEFFYSSIIGFTYEAGYLYQLKYWTEEVEDPPADASSIKYFLLEIVSKEEVKIDS